MKKWESDRQKVLFYMVHQEQVFKQQKRDLLLKKRKK